ncbi:MAG: hypothetical protein WCK77_20530 [Verrucomicrobiota bacterium]
MSEIRQKSDRNSVADLVEFEPQPSGGVVRRFRGHLVIFGVLAVLDGASPRFSFGGGPVKSTHPSHICHIAAADQGQSFNLRHFSLLSVAREQT